MSARGFQYRLCHSQPSQTDNTNPEKPIPNFPNCTDYSGGNHRQYGPRKNLRAPSLLQFSRMRGRAAQSTTSGFGLRNAQSRTLQTTPPDLGARTEPSAENGVRRLGTRPETEAGPANDTWNWLRPARFPPPSATLKDDAHWPFSQRLHSCLPLFLVPPSALCGSKNSVALKKKQRRRPVRQVTHVPTLQQPDEEIGTGCTDFVTNTTPGEKKT